MRKASKIKNKIAAQKTLTAGKLPSAQVVKRLQRFWSSKRNTLELLLPREWPEKNGMILWRLRGGGSALHGQVNELNEIPGLSAMTHVQVWTPPSETLLTHATLPTRSRAKIQQALPYALEEQLVGEPDQLHFAYRILENNNIAVAVTAKERLRAWVSRLADYGLKSSSICPATLALPHDNASWTLVFRETEIWVRTGIASGFAALRRANIPPSQLTMALQEARANQNAPSSLTVLQPPHGFVKNIWSTALELPVQAQQQDFWTDAYDVVPAINLLQGSFAPSSQLRELTPALRPAGIMLAIWLAGSLCFDLWEYWQLKHTNENLRQEMTNLFRKSFPDAVIQNPALQMSRLLGEMRNKSGKTSSADLLPLLGNVAPVIQATDRIKLRGMQYSDSRLTLDVTLPDFQAMESVKNAIIARGIQVEVVGANSTASGIEGRLRLGQLARAGT